MNRKIIKVICWMETNWIDYNLSYNNFNKFLKKLFSFKKHKEFYCGIKNINANWNKETVIEFVCKKMEKEIEATLIKHHVIPVQITKKIILEMMFYEDKKWTKELLFIFDFTNKVEFIQYFNSNLIRNINLNKLVLMNSKIAKLLIFLSTTININKGLELALENMSPNKTIMFLEIVNTELNSLYMQNYQNFTNLLIQHTKFNWHDNNHYNTFLINKDVLSKIMIKKIINLFKIDKKVSLTNNELKILTKLDIWDLKKIEQQKEQILHFNGMGEKKYQKLIYKVQKMQETKQ